MMSAMPRLAPLALALGLGSWLGVLGRGGEPLTVCCAGDSLIRPTPVHLKAIAAAAGESLRVLEWAQGGLNADTYRGFFRRLRAEGRESRCQAVFLQLGTNDAVPVLEGRETADEFKRRFGEVVAGFQAFPGIGRPSPALFVATIPRFCEGPASEAKNGVVETVLNPIVREAAAAAGATVVDNHAVLKDRPDLYDPDCVHPNAAGERALAESWWRALKSSAKGPR
jgi:lysophospholipase L1-like esterase